MRKLLVDELLEEIKLVEKRKLTLNFFKKVEIYGTFEKHCLLEIRSKIKKSTSSVLKTFYKLETVDQNIDRKNQPSGLAMQTS